MGAMPAAEVSGKALAAGGAMRDPEPKTSKHTGG
jgi:hypothetical protein